MKTCRFPMCPTNITCVVLLLTLERMAVYRQLYGDRAVWVRPLSMWDERVERDGYCGPRFTWVREEE